MVEFNRCTDSELISLLNEGNKKAYTEIFNRYFQLMFVFAYNKLRDEELAKDFVQELFTALWHKRERISSEGNLLQYLYISLRSSIYNFFDHQKVEAKYLDFLANFTNKVSNDADYTIRERQLADYIEEQIKRLPPKMREVFELSRKQYLSNREIALKLDTSESNVSQHIGGAKKILSGKINADY